MDGMDSGKSQANSLASSYVPPVSERFKEYLRDFRSIPSLADKLDAEIGAGGGDLAALKTLPWPAGHYE